MRGGGGGGYNETGVKITLSFPKYTPPYKIVLEFQCDATPTGGNNSVAMDRNYTSCPENQVHVQ